MGSTEAAKSTEENLHRNASQASGDHITQQRNVLRGSRRQGSAGIQAGREQINELQEIDHEGSVARVL